MALPKRSRKAWIQFGIAVAIALIFAVIAVAVIFMLFGGLNAQNTQLQQQFAKERAAMEQRLEELTRELNTKPQSRIPQEVVIKVAAPAGKPLTTDLMEVRTLSEGETPVENSFTNLSEVVGEIPARNLFPGEVITKDKLLNTENMLPVDTGKRAIALSVSNVNLLDGAIFEGARVDVLATFKEPALTRTVLTNIRVLKAPSTGKENSRSTRNSSNMVTLEVTPQQAEVLALADRQSDLHFTLRPFGDDSTAKPPGIDALQLANGIQGKAPRSQSTVITATTPASQLGLPKITPFTAKSKPTVSMEILRGTTTETQEFEQQ